MPAGVYQQLLYDRLATLVNIKVEQLKDLQQSKTTSENISLPSHATEPDNVSIQTIESDSPPLKKALTILLNYPDLGRDINLPSELTEVKTEGLPVLCQLITIIKENPGASLGSLLEHWQTAPALQDQLAHLGASSLSFPQSALKNELRDCIDCLYKTLISQKINQLLAKGRSNTLSSEEKVKLQELISKKGLQRTS